MATIRFIHAPTDEDIAGSNDSDTINGQADHYDIHGRGNADGLKCNDVIFLQQQKGDKVYGNVGDDTLTTGQEDRVQMIFLRQGIRKQRLRYSHLLLSI